MRRGLILVFLLAGPCLTTMAQFNLGIGLGTIGPKSLFFEIEPKMQVSEKVAIGLSFISGKFSNSGIDKSRSTFHFDSNFKFTTSGFFIGLGAGLFAWKSEFDSSVGIKTNRGTNFSFMPKIGFQRKISVSISTLYYYSREEYINDIKGIGGYLNVLYILDFKKKN